MNSSKNIIEKRTETLKTLEELHYLNNFVYFISGAVKVHIDDIVDKSVVFRTKETRHILMSKKFDRGF